MTARCGSLRVPFLLQSETLIAGDEGGGSVSQWKNVASFWGRLDTMSNGYRATLDDRLTHSVTARFHSGLSFQLGQRLVFEDRIFMIRLVREENDRRNYVSLYVEEVKYVI